MQDRVYVAEHVFWPEFASLKWSDGSRDEAQIVAREESVGTNRGLRFGLRLSCAASAGHASSPNGNVRLVELGYK